MSLNHVLSMKGLSIEDLLVVQEVQKNDYGRSSGLSRALPPMGITDMYTLNRSQRDRWL